MRFTKIGNQKKDIWGCGDCFWPQSICTDSGASVGGGKTGLLKLGNRTQIRAQMKMGGGDGSSQGTHVEIADVPE